VSKDFLGFLEKRPLTPWLKKSTGDYKIECPYCGKGWNINKLIPIPSAKLNLRKREIEVYVKEHEILSLGDLYRCPKCQMCFAISINRETRKLKTTKIRCPQV